MLLISKWSPSYLFGEWWSATFLIIAQNTNKHAQWTRAVSRQWRRSPWNNGRGLLLPVSVRPPPPLTASFSPHHYVGSQWVTKSVPSTTLAYIIAPSLCLCPRTAEEFLNSFPFMASPSFAHNPFISFHFPLTQHWDMRTKSAFIPSFAVLLFFLISFFLVGFAQFCSVSKRTRTYHSITSL